MSAKTFIWRALTLNIEFQTWAMAGLWRNYARFVEKFPWGSQILQTGVLCASGDVIAQVVVEKKKLSEFEISRVGRFFIMGSCVVAPCIRSWYLVLEKIVKFQGSFYSYIWLLMQVNQFRLKSCSVQDGSRPSFLCTFLSGSFCHSSFCSARLIFQGYQEEPWRKLCWHHPDQLENLASNSDDEFLLCAISTQNIGCQHSCSVLEHLPRIQD